jgi:arylsulfatase
MSMPATARWIVAALLSLAGASALAQDRPNFLIIWGDDIGIYNISAYNDGAMGYRTPNIDRIAAEGVRFTDYYGDQSCTAGRSSFITGQSPLRTGLSKVGLPGSDLGIQARDITLARLLRDRGYATGQFGKNHFGDKDEFLPTNHGFDEFFGNLYHLNAEEEPEDADYPQQPWFKAKFGPRGVIRSYADGRIEDTGALTRKRMETVDEEFLAASLDFIDRAHAADKPFFVWFNATHMHFRTHTKASDLGRSGQGPYNDTMMGHDETVGKLLAKLDELGVANNTVVLYTTDNGPHFNTWPDAAITPYRSEKNSNWEGAYRVPAMIRWPDRIPAGAISNDIISHLDWVPTLMAAAGEPGVADKLKNGMTVEGRQYRVHLDGYNFLPRLTGQADQGPRQVFHYLEDSGMPVGVRVGDWKVVYAEQRGRQMGVWSEPMVVLKLPKIFHLRRDPFERADLNSNVYWDWVITKAPYIYLGLATTAQFLQTFQEFPPSQRADSWSVEKLTESLLRKAEQQSRN